MYIQYNAPKNNKIILYCYLITWVRTLILKYLPPNLNTIIYIFVSSLKLIATLIITYLHFFCTSLKGDGQTKVTCVKKHFLQVGNRILLINGLNDTRVETKIVSVISEKAFKLSDDVKLDCDAYYVVKLLSRKDQDSYVSNGISNM